MNVQDEQEQLRSLAAQLRVPHGEDGKIVAQMMQTSNMGMTRHSVFCLQLKAKERVLEIGHGNCSHLEMLLDQADHIHYTGLELSELMYQEARTINAVFIENGKAAFHLYDGKTLPFEENSFHKIFTVNTVYFWEEPEYMLAELYRILRPGGRLNITFANADFMEQLPFVQYGFELYNESKLKELADRTAFHWSTSDSRQEKVQSKTGDWVNRTFTTVMLSK